MFSYLIEKIDLIYLSGKFISILSKNIILTYTYP